MSQGENPPGYDFSKPADRLLHVKQELRMTQSALAERLGIAKVTMSRYINDKRDDIRNNVWEKVQEIDPRFSWLWLTKGEGPVYMERETTKREGEAAGREPAGRGESVVPTLLAELVRENQQLASDVAWWRSRAELVGTGLHDPRLAQAAEELQNQGARGPGTSRAEHENG